jgi:hypothetical protein
MSHEMSAVAWLCYASAAIPLAAATWANRRTSLLHTMVWTWFAWPLWGITLAGADRRWDYAALCVTACAGIAVFGARRPGVAAWNFVSVGLLVVLLLPLAEGAATDAEFHLGVFRIVFLIMLLGMIIMNYLPTWLALGGVLLLLACAWLISGFFREGDGPTRPLVAFAFGLAPWVAWIGYWIGQLGRTDFDGRWLAFRDRYGVVWGQRLREQFHRRAAVAGWDAKLSWSGLRLGPRINDDQRLAMDEALASLLKRFMSD